MKSKKNNQLPIIFIFDMDNTIIGDSSYISIYKEIISYIMDGCKHKRLKTLCNIDKDIWKKNIHVNFIRPYFKKFIEEIKRQFPTAEFFIYSAGTKKYVEYIIEYVEEILNIKFNRPLFTRDDIGRSIYNNEFLKDITGFTDNIFESLHKKYKLIDKDIDFILNERTIIIDDNKEVWNNNYRHIVCPKYTYCPIIELDIEILKYIYCNVENIHTAIYEKYKDYDFLPELIPNITFNEFLMEYHFKMFMLYKYYFKENIENIKDNYFNLLLDKIKLRNKYKKIFEKSFLKTIKNII